MLFWAPASACDGFHDYPPLTPLAGAADSLGLVPVCVRAVVAPDTRLAQIHTVYGWLGFRMMQEAESWVKAFYKAGDKCE